MVCYDNDRSNKRGVAQFGSVLGSGPRGRGFESRRPDHWYQRVSLDGSPLFFYYLTFF